MVVCFAGAFPGAWVGRAVRQAWQTDADR
jgi:hypothetical protein